MRILICYDECYKATQLAYIIKRKFPLENITVEVSFDFDDANHKITYRSYDVAFIKTRIAYHDGFDLAKAIKLMTPQCLLVFIGDKQSEIQQAFQFHAFQFFHQDMDRHLLDTELSRLFHYYKQQHAKCVLYHQGNQSAFLPQDILYIETRDHRLRMVTMRGKYEGNVMDLAKMKSELLNFHFYQMHQSYFVNMDYIATIKRGELTLKNGEILPTSILNRHCVKAMIKKFLLWP